MDEEYLGHLDVARGIRQSLSDHLFGVSALAGEFASIFGEGAMGRWIGIYHDIGKYSKEFQRYIRGDSITRTDHSTAGAQLIAQRKDSSLLAAMFCVAGHHAGLPDLGSRGDMGRGTLCSRLKKIVPDCRAFQTEIPPEMFSLPVSKLFTEIERDNFSVQFYIRMLFSCLVDADFLDTEKVMTAGTIQRSNFSSLDELCCRYDKIVQEKFFNEDHADYNLAINKCRRNILDQCLQAGDVLQSGLVSLTVPTGGGKTIASLGYALHQAVKQRKQRIIYVIPYTSIIEQNAKVFGDLLGANNIVEHHSNIEYDVTDDNESFRCLATENWDAPIIVTTNVQFFESLFANRTSNCRKIHNIADSVIIFDEAQMIPLNFLRPCLRTIEELVKHYDCTAVLCTATQPALQSFFQTKITEICTMPQEDSARFVRVSYQHRHDKMTLEMLANELAEKEQVLCIVNTKWAAKEIYELLHSKQENIYYLSTNLCAVHRSCVLAEIRERLVSYQPCRVIATSLIEAGVDIDFPFVYRELIGLDSIIQAAGRCNREGKRDRKNSKVTVFSIAERPRQFGNSRACAASEKTLESYGNRVDSLEAIKSYFMELYDLEGDHLDEKSILNMIDKGDFPFVKLAADFKLIDENTQSVYIPFDIEGEMILQEIEQSHCIINRQWLRRAGRYLVNVYAGNARQPFEKLLAAQKIELLYGSVAVLRDISIYDKVALGLDTNIEDGQEIIF